MKIRKAKDLSDMYLALASAYLILKEHEDDLVSNEELSGYHYAMQIVKRLTQNDIHGEIDYNSIEPFIKKEKEELTKKINAML